MNGNTIDVERLRESLKSLGWAKLVAIMLILGGVATIFTFIGLPLGIFQISVALKLWRAANDLSSFKTRGNVSHLYSGIYHLTLYFNWYGWLMMIWVTIILGILVFILISAGTLGSILERILNEY